jgi:hypothetical protein
MPNQTEEDEQVFLFGPFVYNIDKALKIIAADKERPTTPLPVAHWARSLCLEKTLDEYMAEGRIPLLRGELDEEYARTSADLTVPVIVGDLRLKDDGGEPGYMLIDGTHRLRRAYLEGRETLDAYVLTLAETKKIRSSAQYGPSRRRRP